MSDDQKAWRCTLCGYVHRGDSPPECCPICGASADEFEPYEDPAAQQVLQTATQWRCLNCNYIHEGDAPLDMCPICGVDAEQFEPIPDIETDAGSSMKPIHAVIVGGGIAGTSAAEAIRNASPDSKITLISHEPRTPYYRLNLTRYLAGEIESTDLAIHPESWYIDNRIDLLTGQKIVELDANEKEVVLDNGTAVSYDKLILTMGSHPFVPPVPGTDLKGVYTVRTAADADAILQHINSGTACICIGGGILGLETAGALAKRGGDVTLLESHQWLMPRQLNAQAAKLLEAHMTGLGVKLKKEARTQEIHGLNGQVAEVVLKDGEHIPCGMVVICTGVRPNTHLARKAGLEVDKGILVDNHLITSDPDILAAGDVAEHNGIVYGVWGPSQFQGTIAGLNALGIPTPFGGVPRSNALKVLGLEMLSIGQFIPEDGSYLVIQEQVDKLFYHFVFHDGRLAGCILLGDTKPASRVTQAIEGKKDFSALLAGTPDCKAILNTL